MGMLWATYRADPWTKKTLANGLNPELAAKAVMLCKICHQNTRLGIPLFLAEEAPHGHMAIGTTVFPTGLGLAATWSETLPPKGRSSHAKSGCRAVTSVTAPYSIWRVTLVGRVWKNVGRRPCAGRFISGSRGKRTGWRRFDETFAPLPPQTFYRLWCVGSPPDGGPVVGINSRLFSPPIPSCHRCRHNVGDDLLQFDGRDSKFL